MKIYTKIVLPIATALFLSAFAFNVFATGEHKVTICHRTDSATNPYVRITVDKNAADGVSGNSGNQADHYGEHQGPVAASEAYAQGLKNSHIEWGDIIPPVVPHHGLNWNTQGQAMWNSGCNFSVTSPTPSPTPTPRTSSSPAPTPSPKASASPSQSPSPSTSPSPTPSPSSTPSPTPSPIPTPTPIATSSTCTSCGSSQEQHQEQHNTQTVNVIVPQVLPATGLGVLGMTTIFGGGPLGLVLAKYGQGKLVGKREENLSEFASRSYQDRNTRG